MVPDVLERDDLDPEDRERINALITSTELVRRTHPA